MIALIVIVSALIYISFRLYRRRQVLEHLKRFFDIPPLYPIVGNLPLFPWDVPGLFKTIKNIVNDYGPNVLIAGPLYNFTLVISNSKEIESILANSNSKAAKKSLEYELLQPWLRTGLLTSDGEKWFQRRKIITPSFHFSILEQFVDVMDKQSNIFVNKLQPLLGKRDVNIHDFVTLFALDVICEASMGIQINAQSAPDSKYVLGVKEITSLIYQRVFSFLKRVPGLYIFFPSGRRFYKLVKELHAFTTDVIKQRRNEIKSSNFSKNKNFMDMLLSANIDGKPLSDEDIREEVDTFMFEGHDTTTSAISFTLYQLALHPDIQEKIYKEVAEIYENDSKTKMTYQKLNEMKYLEMVIKETLRIMPSVPFIGRTLTEDMYLDNCLVPAGSNIIISVYSLHNDPKLFPEPEKFNPERFDPNNTHKPFSYIPFSAGGRNCIGQRFAMLELKTVISKLIMNYRFLPATENGSVILQTDLILRSANGVNMQVLDKEMFAKMKWE